MPPHLLERFKMTKTVKINKKQYEVYADIADANEYFSTVYNSGWEDIDDEEKAKLLLMATRHIDSVEWRGVLKEPEQKLQFPRMIDGHYSDDELVTYACCEEAMAIFENGSSSESGSADVKSIKVQDTEITFKDGASTAESNILSSEVERYLSKYMNKGIKVLY